MAHFPFGLFHHVANAHQALAPLLILSGLNVHDAVQIRALVGNLFDGDRANPRGLIDLNQLFGGGIRPGDDDVAQQHGKRLIAYKFGCNQHSVTEAQRFFLPRVTERDHAAELANHFRKIWAAAVGEKTFQAGKRIEVVLDGVLRLCR